MVKYSQTNLVLLGKKISEDKTYFTASVFDMYSKKLRYFPGPISRRGLAAISSANYEILLIGGWRNREISGTVQRFNYNSGEITELAPMNLARWGHAAANVDGDAVVCGGWDGYTRFKSCELYLRAEDRWKDLPDMSECRAFPGVVCLSKRRVLVMGGGNEIGHLLSTVVCCKIPENLSESDKCKNNFWKPLAPMKFQRLGHACTVFNGNVFVAGGIESSRSVEMFTPPENDQDIGQWTILSDMCKERCFFSLVAVDSKLLAFGGAKYRDCFLEEFQMPTFKNAKTNSASIEDENEEFDLNSSESCDGEADLNSAEDADLKSHLKSAKWEEADLYHEYTKLTSVVANTVTLE